MAEPILLDRYRDNAYNQNQIINDKLDFLIGEMRDMKQDIRALDKKIEEVRKESKAEISDLRTELKGEISDLRKEFKAEMHTARWQVIGVVIAQICSIGAIVWAVVSAVK